MRDFLISTARALWKFIIRYSDLVWALGVSILGVFLQRAFYFKDNPFFGLEYFGEVLISSGIFLLVYFFGKTVVRFIAQWFENVLYKTFSRIFNDFWRVYANRMVDAIIRREGSLESSEKASEEDYKGAVLLDTSTIIDGRILGVIQTGFLDNRILVSENVIDELQRMADKNDVLKRQKGRRGLDILNEIKEEVGRDHFRVIDMKSAPKLVDKSLVEFCKKHGAKIATVDYNLNKVAKVAGVSVLNVNKLSNEIKTNLLPGEVLLVKLVQEGKENDQGVGYLEDGTMIVVKEAIEFVGSEQQVMVDKVLQTSAGRMVFASVC